MAGERERRSIPEAWIAGGRIVADRVRVNRAPGRRGAADGAEIGFVPQSSMMARFRELSAVGMAIARRPTSHRREIFAAHETVRRDAMGRHIASDHQNMDSGLRDPALPGFEPRLRCRQDPDIISATASDHWSPEALPCESNQSLASCSSSSASSR
jgi:hypothetical protein